MMKVVLSSLAEYNYVIEVYDYTDPHQVSKRLVHYHGKGRGRVCHTKIHDPALEGEISGSESGF